MFHTSVCCLNVHLPVTVNLTNGHHLVNMRILEAWPLLFLICIVIFSHLLDIF